MINNVSIAVHAFVRLMLISLSTEEMLMLRYVNSSNNFRMEMAPFWLRTQVLCFIYIYIEVNCVSQCKKDSAWGSEFTRSAWSSAKSDSVLVSGWYRLLLAYCLRYETLFFYLICGRSKYIALELVLSRRWTENSFFTIAATPRCRGGRYSIPRIAPLYPWSSPYCAEC